MIYATAVVTAVGTAVETAVETTVTRVKNKIIRPQGWFDLRSQFPWLEGSVILDVDLTV